MFAKGPNGHHKPFRGMPQIELPKFYIAFGVL